MVLGSIARGVRERARTLPQRHGGRTLLVLAAIVLLGFGLRLESAINPPANAGADSVVAYQGNDAKAYEQIAAALYEHGRYGTPRMHSPSDWSPGAPLFYAGVYFVTGGVDPG